jgi:tellurite resistance protein TehA-like permease
MFAAEPWFTLVPVPAGLIQVTAQSRRTFSDAIRTLYPGYFALVMATGIVSIAAFFLHWPTISSWLFKLNLIFYAALSILYMGRLVFYSSSFLADITSHAKGPGFLTAVAATSIVGSQLAILKQNLDMACALWIFALILWIILLYTVLTAVTVVEPKPPFEQGLNGGWLLIVVSTQSISVLGSLVAPHFGTQQSTALFISLVAFLVGCMLYIPIISLIFYRWTFFNMTPEQLTPPYWINMGALAITTLAGGRLILNASSMPLLADLVPFLKGFTLFFWAMGAWWIPLLLILGFWRHGYKRIPLTYDPQYWGMVFPLGMYATCTFILARAIEVPALEKISSGFFYPALFAWTVTFIGMVVSLARVSARILRQDG